MLERARVQTRKFGRRVTLWLVAIGLILTVIVTLMFSSIILLLKSEAWVGHSYQVIDALDLTEAYYSEAQSAERGYAATCKPALLSPFYRDLPQIFGQLATLRQLTADNPLQQQRTRSLSKLVAGELEHMGDVISVARAGRQVDAERMLADSADATTNQKISTLIDEMQKDERRLLASRLKDVSLFAWTTLASCGFGLLLIVGILGFVLRLIRRETARRERTETSLYESNKQLAASLEDVKKFNAAGHAMSLLGELLQTSRTTEEALSVFTNHLGESFPEGTVSVALFNNSRELLDVVQRRGTASTFETQFRSADCWALRRGRMHSAGPGQFEPSCTHADSATLHTLCLPMVAQGETLGVVTIATETPLSDFEAQSVQTGAEQLSLAIANLQLQETLRHQSLRDPLTGLFNRRYMDEAMERELIRANRQKLPMAIAMMDIDHFKRFNDTYGHDGGDVLLNAFGRVLANHARGDDILCRYGGEEFALIMPGADKATAASRLEEIRLAVKKLQAVANGQSLGPVSMSAGVAVFPDDGHDGATVTKAADAALYGAKHGGRDRVMCAGASVARVRSGGD